MRFSVIGRFILITSLGAGIGALGGCKPNPPPDVLKTQRESMDKAKAVEGVLLQADTDQRRKIDDASK
jgi:hypothetical protein